MIIKPEIYPIFISDSTMVTTVLNLLQKMTQRRVKSVFLLEIQYLCVVFGVRNDTEVTLGG